MDFILATPTPGQLSQALRDRDILDENNLPTRDGIRPFTPIPNPIEGNTLSMFLSRFVREAEAWDDEGDVGVDDRFERSKLVKWIKANGVPGSFNRYTQEEVDNGQEQVVINYYRADINGVTVYITKDIETIGVWM